jgi:hypothetical protein
VLELRAYLASRLTELGLATSNNLLVKLAPPATTTTTLGPTTTTTAIQNAHYEDLGGVHAAVPVAVSRTVNRIDLFSRGMDNALWHNAWNGASWSDWESLEGLLTSGPSVVSWASGRLDVFALGPGSTLLHRYWAGTWAP